MSFAFGSFTLGAALLFSAFKNQSLVSLILGQPGQSVASQGESHPSAHAPSGSGEETMVPLAATGSGGYVDPFSSSATSGRIDQGKDIGGSGPVRAFGDVKVVKVGGFGWPGEPPGKGVLLKVLSGPAKGKYWYIYEGFAPSVRAGQVVRAGGVLGHIIPGTSTGIETGWSDASGAPLSHGEYTEGKETRYGKAFDQFLHALGFK